MTEKNKELIQDKQLNDFVGTTEATAPPEDYSHIANMMDMSEAPTTVQKEEVIVLSAAEMLALAQKSQITAYGAKKSADKALEMSQKVLSQFLQQSNNIPNNTEQGEFLRKELVAVRDILYTQQSAIAAEKIGTELAQQALDRAAAEVDKAHREADGAQAEALRLQRIVQQEANSCETLKQKRNELSDRIKTEEEKLLAATAAAQAGESLTESAEEQKEIADKLFQEAEKFDKEAREKYRELQLNANQTRETASSILTQLRCFNAELPEDMEALLQVCENNAPTESILQKKVHKTTGFRQKLGKGFWDFLKIMGLALIIAFFLRTFVLTVTMVEGTSMQPTLLSGERLFTSKLSYQFSEPQRFDIIWFNAPDMEKTYFVKRIIGLPGEQLKISNGIVSINGERLTEPYLQGVTTKGDLEIFIPENSYFVMGDNREASLDSRYFGIIPDTEIEGKVIFCLFPFSEFGKIE